MEMARDRMFLYKTLLLALMVNDRWSDSRMMLLALPEPSGFITHRRYLKVPSVSAVKWLVLSFFLLSTVLQHQS